MEKYENNTIAKMAEARNKVKQAIDLFSEADGLMRGGPSSFYIDKFFGYARGLFERFAPLKVGDLAVSVTDRHAKAVAERPDHGWRGSVHNLAPGRAAIVREVDFDGERQKFVYGIEPLRQTVISSMDGKHLQVTSPYMFYVLEGDYERINGKEDRLTFGTFERVPGSVLIWKSGDRLYHTRDLSAPEDRNDIFFFEENGTIQRVHAIPVTE